MLKVYAGENRRQMRRKDRKEENPEEEMRTARRRSVFGRDEVWAGDVRVEEIGHVFHSECGEWFKTKNGCPVCRDVLETSATTSPRVSPALAAGRSRSRGFVRRSTEEEVKHWRRQEKK